MIIDLEFTRNLLCIVVDIRVADRYRDRQSAGTLLTWEMEEERKEGRKDGREKGKKQGDGGEREGRKERMIKKGKEGRKEKEKEKKEEERQKEKELVDTTIAINDEKELYATNIISAKAKNNYWYKR